MRLKDPFCALSHGLGSLLAIVGLVFLIVESKGDPWRITSFAIYGATLILLYLASALYHSLPVSKKAEETLYGLDRTGIYLLIAGTYTPVCLVGLGGGGWGWSLFGIIWGLAAAGITLDWVTKRQFPHWLQATLYLLMGWVFLIALKPMLQAMTATMFVWLLLGSAIYTVGAAIVVKHPQAKPGKFHFHDAWHLLVIAASACHFVMMVLLAKA